MERHEGKSRLEQPKFGADGRIRTAYLLITNQLLYQLSYAGAVKNTYFVYESKSRKNIN